ncbi:uncharacterized protein LOC112597253 [Melanaphis sacchari]|uniref:uncharacterized protein LOC112597253 n=1 Tax=Melanaphis sacchari TaxID=742174 RepID=UPI000DC15678|nr:uncharacterized protein LOC112597253 [Melanaphis sacchari]
MVSTESLSFDMNPVSKLAMSTITSSETECISTKLTFAVDPNSKLVDFTTNFYKLHGVAEIKTSSNFPFQCLAIVMPPARPLTDNFFVFFQRLGPTRFYPPTVIACRFVSPQKNLVIRHRSR